MAIVVSCTDLMDEAQREYGAVSLVTRTGAEVRLTNLLMLSPDRMKTARVLLGAVSKGAASELDEVMPQLRDLLLLVADRPEDLAAEMDEWPIGMYVRVINLWQDGTQVPEAPRSDS
ncbi:phage tail assembly protein [Streptomyces sp. AV19]|nr:phage tail assembly protein [Streptomyces sp. AV19]